MKIFPILLISNIAANEQADDSIDELIKIRLRAKKLFEGDERWRSNMRKNIESITDAMIRTVTKNVSR